MSLRSPRVVALLVVLLAPTGCGGGTTTDPGAGQATATTSAVEPSRECLGRQKGGYARVHAAVQRLTGIALRQPDDVPQSAIDEVRKRVGFLPDETDPPCATPLGALRDAADALQPGELDHRALRRVIEELHRWRGALGRPEPLIRYEAGNMVSDTSDLCPLLRDRVEVTYQVRYRERPTGREGWLVVMIDNRYHRALTIGHHGTARIEGSRVASWKGLEWGASSGDYSTAWPGKVGRHMIGDFGRYGPRPLRLRPGGTITPTRVSTFATIDELGGWCDLPDARRRPG